MANPYDLTSGFFAAKALRQQEADSAAVKDYRDSLSSYYRQSARKMGIENDALEKRVPLIDFALAKASKSLGLNSQGGTKATSSQSPIDYTSLSSGYTFGMAPVNYGFTEPEKKSAIDTPDLSVNARPTTPPAPGAEINVDGYADGTRGGVGIRMPGSAPVAQQQSVPMNNGEFQGPTEGAETAPTTGGSASGMQMFSERDPQQADSITRRVLGMSNKEFQSFAGAMSMVDFASGKITSDQMAENVEKLRKIQAEGVMRAAQQALSGNEKKAIALYHEYGEDTDSVVSMKKISIANPVPGAAKGTKDAYDGVLVTMKDGSKMTLDPRRLSLDIVGTAKSMEHDEKVASSIRATDASVHSTDERAAATRFAAKQHKELQDERALDRAMDRVKGELTSDLGQLRKSFLDPSSPQFIANEEARERMSKQIDLDAQNAINVANANITMFNNPRISYQGVKQAMSMGQGVPGPDGKPITKDVNGQRYALTPYNNIWIPVSQKPAQ